MGLFALCGAVAVFGQAAAMAGIPSMPRELRSLEVPPGVSQVLDNGAEVTFLEFGSVPKVSISAVFRIGRLDEKENIWLVKMMAEMLKGGTQRSTAMQIAAQAAQMGGEITVEIEESEVLVSIDVLSERAADGARLLLELLMQPKFSESALLQVRSNLRQELSTRLAQPGYVARIALLQAMYGDHPYGRIFPSMNHLEAYGTFDIRQFYEAYVGTRRTHIYVVGRFDQSAVNSVITSELNKWRRGSLPQKVPPFERNGREVILIDRPDASQSTIRVGVGLEPVSPTHSDYPALFVANALLGGMITSRITMNLRERRGWAYSPSSKLEVGYGHTAWVQYAEVTTSRTVLALAEIVKEIETVRAKPPSESEISAAKNYCLGTLALSSASRKGITTLYRFRDLHGLSDQWFNDFSMRLSSVSRNDVSRVAGQYLKPQTLTVVIVGDLEKIKSQVDVSNGIQ
jgi:zinc protease